MYTFRHGTKYFERYCVTPDSVSLVSLACQLWYLAFTKSVYKRLNFWFPEAYLHFGI